MEWILLASSGTIEGIKESIKRFYCGEEKRLEGENLYRADGTQIKGMRVIIKKGRYRFETLRQPN